MSKSKESRHFANRRHYQKNREKILQKRRASRFELQARLEYLESALSQTRLLPPISELWKSDLPPICNLLKPELPPFSDLFNPNPLNTKEKTHRTNEYNLDVIKSLENNVSINIGGDGLEIKGKCRTEFKPWVQLG
ncbi:8568_t:CDS:2 [Dentiscutata erythropus]|uniref:8568_t:CDS:1 n=1 Tax=Dentiscutata erythropus TaxID=1348616 RepID=A0A9N9ATI1_9GLOM|nr:8568_t:CDS:2 [Dentiscutata erythropus]